MKLGPFLPGSEPRPKPGASNTGKIRVDMHVHTCYSHDAFTTLQEVITEAPRRGLGAVAITDHNEIAGALELQRIAPFPVIVGEEVRSSQGEIIGLFLQEWIPPGLSPAETVARVHDQGGLVYVPHPFDILRDSTIQESALLSIVHEVQALEVFNARVIQPAHNERAQEFARTRALPGGAGSDAHTVFELGQAYVEMRSFHDRDSFLHSLAGAHVGGGLSNPGVHLFSTLAKMQKPKTPKRVGV